MNVTMSESPHPIIQARRAQMFPTLAPADIDRLRRFGETRSYGLGERIIRAGHVAPGLIVILSGKVEVSQGRGLGRREIIVTHEPRQFAGELAQLSARPSLVDAEAVEPVEALVIRSDSRSSSDGPIKRMYCACKGFSLETGNRIVCSIVTATLARKR